MFFDLMILLGCALVTVAAVRLLVIRGIERLSEALHLSSKTKGQIIGYATSTPELVVLVASAFAGVFKAGFWNIASSNIINIFLFLGAVLVYRQQMKLFSLRFLDEVFFGICSVAAPLVLFWADTPLTPFVALGLLAAFFVYKAGDRLFNQKPGAETAPAPVRGSVTLGILYLVLGLALIIVAGRYLGDSAGTLVKEAGTPPWLVGWVLGLITSIPEMASFFEIFRLSKKRQQLHLKEDMQQALDALVASNMCNLGIILAVGILVYTFFG